VEKVQDGNPPVYKNITRQGYGYKESLETTGDFSFPFIVWQMGTFEVSPENNDLVSTPLGIYSSEEVYHSTGTRLMTTPYPGSFISQPAAGVTTLESAKMIKGEKPIDAIRIRVSGIDSYHEKAQEKIERVAMDLLEMGYEVDIVAGSSFVKQKMEVEGLGTVTSPWTTLGVAQSLSSSWNSTTLLNTILFALFGIAWFVARLLYERNALSEEKEILHKIGWSEKQIRIKQISEQMIALTLAFLIGIGILYLLVPELSSIIYKTPLILWVLTILMVVFLFSRKKRKNKQTIGYSNFASLTYYRHLIYPVMAILIFSVILVGIQVTSIMQAIFEARESTLGMFTTNGLLRLNLIVFGATLFLTLGSVNEAVRIILLNRKKEIEMYHVIGWTKKMIRRHLTKEILIWAGISCITGMLFSLILLMVMDLSIKWMLFIGLCALVLLCIPVILVSRVQKWIGLR